MGRNSDATHSFCVIQFFTNQCAHLVLSKESLEVSMSSPASLYQWEKPARSAYLILAVFTIFSWICYVAFVKNPENLIRFSFFPVIFGYAFRVFAQLHVVLCGVALFLLFRRHLSATFFKGLVGVYLISLCAELGGTSVGLLFGHYTYSELLGPKVFGFVPMLVPLSWFLVSCCAFGASASLFPRAGIASGCKRVLSTAAMIVLWDLTLDPAMSHVFNYWHWNVPGGVYFGAPWTNFLGWSVTGMTIGLALNSLGFQRVTSRIPHQILLAHYFLFTGLSSGFLLLAGVYLPLILAASGYFVWALATGLLPMTFSLSSQRKEAKLR
jgi:uncharacterized membrane protein